MKLKRSLIKNDMTYVIKHTCIPYAFTFSFLSYGIAVMANIIYQNTSFVLTIVFISAHTSIMISDNKEKASM